MSFPRVWDGYGITELPFQGQSSRIQRLQRLVAFLERQNTQDPAKTHTFQVWVNQSKRELNFLGFVKP